jgi:hypothetical protein
MGQLWTTQEISLVAGSDFSYPGDGWTPFQKSLLIIENRKQ